MSEFKVTRSIIYKCYAIKIPQSFGEKLAGVAQIVPCYELPYELCTKMAALMSAGDKSTEYWIDRLTDYKSSFITQLTRELNSRELPK
ncbi:hypothetical protein A8A01_10065 [Ewingella americana]|uniref:hypothetical protein n=1 Tax=Rahnella victoriana TaxID=1510570 RepID=UPI000BB1F2D3|nr:hypothetical protein [Rahnella victoriana]PBI79645.1 hypothetical protein A9993_07785 [Rahnella victoriana]PKB89979.1 hypothetical protein A8A01_10065 [Ewingella americana]